MNATTNLTPAARSALALSARRIASAGPTTSREFAAALESLMVLVGELNATAAMEARELMRLEALAAMECLPVAQMTERTVA